MNVRILLDGIVRQTTVLIAQIATTAGGRAPVAQLANQVFLDLTQALQEQGVGRKVIADMFGLALRSYQQKVQRLTESGSDANTTLWDAIHRYVGEQKVVTRADLARRSSRCWPRRARSCKRCGTRSRRTMHGASRPRSSA